MYCAAKLATPDPWIYQTSAPRAVILLYHRVFAASQDPLLSCVSPEHFASHLEILSTYNVVSLSELTQQLKHGELQQRTVAITFDDGYSDYTSVAAPLLKDLHLPATFFVATNEDGFWWDKLAQIVLHTERLPASLSLSATTPNFRWDLGQAADYTLSEQKQHGAWNILEQQDPSERHRLYRALHDLLKTSDHDLRTGILEELDCWKGTSTTPPTNRLSQRDLKELSAQGFEIGSHTCNHSLLSSLPLKEQQVEIETSKAHLERMLEKEVTSFAYPYGGRTDYTPDTVQLVMHAGYRQAVSNVPNVVWKSARLYELPRLLLRDCDGEFFERWLDSWFRTSKSGN